MVRTIFRWTPRSPQDLAPTQTLARLRAAPASKGLSLCRSRWWSHDASPFRHCQSLHADKAIDIFRVTLRGPSRSPRSGSGTVPAVLSLETPMPRLPLSCLLLPLLASATAHAGDWRQGWGLAPLPPVPPAQAVPRAPPPWPSCACSRSVRNGRRGSTTGLQGRCRSSCAPPRTPGRRPPGRVADRGDSSRWSATCPPRSMAACWICDCSRCRATRPRRPKMSPIACRSMRPACVWTRRRRGDSAMTTRRTATRSTSHCRRAPWCWPRARAR